VVRLVVLYSKHNIPSVQLKVCRNGTIKIDLETNKIMDFIKFDVGNVVMVTGGRNTGRVGVIKNREK
jgi:ribosomal protein S4E